MIAPSRVDLWMAEAVIRVYEPWLSSNCVAISGRQLREVADLVTRARRITGAVTANPAGAVSPTPLPRAWQVVTVRGSVMASYREETPCPLGGNTTWTPSTSSSPSATAAS